MNDIVKSDIRTDSHVPTSPRPTDIKVDSPIVIVPRPTDIKY
jgi:hypothetical protein